MTTPTRCPYCGMIFLRASLYHRKSCRCPYCHLRIHKDDLMRARHERRMNKKKGERQKWDEVTTKRKLDMIIKGGRLR